MARRPPARAERLMQTVLPTETAAHGVIGDLREEHALRSRRRPRVADLWFWWQAITIYLRFRREQSRARATRRREPVGVLRQDLRFAFRGFRRAPGFTVVATLTLALGIGSTTAIFGLVYGIMLSPLSFHEPDRIAALWPEKWFSKGLFQLFEERLISEDRPTSFAAIAGWEPQLHTLRDEDGAIRTRGPWVTARFFDVLAGTAALGRTFGPEEDQPGSADVAVISHGFWQRRFGGDPGVLGRRIQLRDKDRTIIGVMPPMFDFIQAQADVVVPMGLGPTEPRYRSDELKLVARLKPGATVEQASTELQTVIAQLRREYSAPDDWGRQARAMTLQEFLVGDIRPTLLLLLGAVGLILLITTANVAGLFLARSLERQREIAVRVALGARPGRLVRQLGSEATVLGFIGAIPGLGLGAVGLRGILALLPDAPMRPWEMPRLHEVGISGAVVTVAVVLAIATGWLAGLAPALQTVRRDVRDSLTGGRAGTNARQRQYLRSGIVVGQIALAVVLLANSGLLIKSFWRLTSVDPGFDSQDLLSFWHTPQDFESSEEYFAYFDGLDERLAAAPGVLSVAGANDQPFFSESGATPIYRADREDEEGVQGVWRGVTPNLFQTLGIRLVQGRLFTEADQEGVPNVGVLTESAASRLFGSESAIGQVVSAPIELGESFTVVGVVADVKSIALDRESPAAIYRPDAQTGPGRIRFGAWGRMIVVRMDGDPATTAAPVVSAARDYDRAALVTDVQPVSQLLYASLTDRRVPMIVLSLFTAAAMLLAAIGIYGVMSYTVRARAKELGIRIALGAPRGRVLSSVLRSAAIIAVPGAIAGLALGVGTSQLLKSFVFEISSSDPLVLGGAGVLALFVAAAASFFPARRAGLVDPVSALTAE